MFFFGNLRIEDFQQLNGAALQKSSIRNRLILQFHWDVLIMQYTNTSIITLADWLP